MTTSIKIIGVILVAIGASRLLLQARAKRSDDEIPILDLWEIIFEMIRTGKTEFYTIVSDKVLGRLERRSRGLLGFGRPEDEAEVVRRRQKLVEANIVRLTMFPFLPNNIFIFKNPAGAKLFHNQKEFSFLEGYAELVKRVWPPEVHLWSMNYDLVTPLARTLRNDSLERYAGSYVIPETLRFIRRQEQAALKTDTGATHGTVTDAMESFYDLVTHSAIRSFCGHTLSMSPKSAERLEELCRLVYLSDAENMAKENPLQVMFPWFPPFSRKRDAIFNAFKALIGEIVADYVAFPENVAILNLEGKEREEFKDRDFMESMIIMAWDREKQEVNVSRVFGCIYSIIFAAVSNQYVTTVLFLLYVHFNPDYRRVVISELQGLTDYIRKNDIIPPIEEEVEATVTSSGEKSIPIAVFDNMPFLEAGVLETLRLSLNNILPRKVTSDVKLANGEVIKKGLMTFSAQGACQLSEEFHPDPVTFDPRRFLRNMKSNVPALASDITSSEFYSKIQSGSLMDEDGGVSRFRCLSSVQAAATGGFTSFGMGRHPCTGAKFAMLQIKMFSALILGCWDIDFPDSKDMSDVKVQFVGVARPTKAVKLTFVRRKDSLL
ncbi:hypothetical protein HDU67_000845 [Dinochytrium kinnereticum]|nr:hypothetical protein HDU67_000845 [Dinochytrium kinnereticum]